MSKSSRTDIWVSCPRFTAMVVVNDRGRIVEAAPFVRKFVGQAFLELVRWAGKYGAVRVEELSRRGASNA